MPTQRIRFKSRLSTEQCNWVVATLKRVEQRLLAGEIIASGLGFSSTVRSTIFVCPNDAQECNVVSVELSGEHGAEWPFVELNRPNEI